ncbi:electron transfer flavoprotein subunit beta/FixA family protein [Arthrobacter sp. NPDC093128]|uniref:electron transfer flavoprotein subunit beta/FixA family protein n=1 Tax=Arthrobacter sp. NPDC093128 TaxID=3154979 RepID=UPI003428EB44
MKIVVLMKQVPDTDEGLSLDLSTGLLERQNGELMPDEINERSLDVALSYKDSHKGTEVVVLSMGPDAAGKAVRKGLQVGADSAVHISDPALSGADALRTAAVLAAALNTMDFDIVIAGNESTDGSGGVVPAMISEILALPLLGAVHNVTITEDSVAAEREEDGRRTAVHAALPALVSVTERSAEPRFPNFKGILSAKRKTVTTLSLEDLPDIAASRCALLAVTKRPVRTGGVKIFDDGDAGLQLASFLASSQLI